jgi:pseudouridine-5'-phosphate glycosidase
MTQPIPISELFQPKTKAADVEIFDPPMCCPTGMCGPTIDQTLLDLNEVVMTLESKGVSVARYQMSSHPNAFLSNGEVMKIVRDQQMAALPITVIHGKVIKVGSYPNLAEFEKYLEVAKS